MSSPSKKQPGKRGKKVRVALRPNRSKKPRESGWTRKVRDAGDQGLDSARSESIAAKGDLSRRRTVTEFDADAPNSELLRRGVVSAVFGRYVDVDDGRRVWPCTVRRTLRTRLSKERHPVIVGDRVRFLIEADGEGVQSEGVIEFVEPRRGVLKRRVRKRNHTIVANVDQALIVSSAGQPAPKPHLIDRYIVAALAGEITPIVCMNKIDLDTDGSANEIVESYAALGYRGLSVSAIAGTGMEQLRGLLENKETVIVGQSGVGKSSILNAIQPGLKLKIGDVVEHTDKGRHTTTTARLLRLDIGGYVVDTPGVKSFDLSTVERHEFEMHFVEFAEFIPNCKFANCTHTHEQGCEVKGAVERGEIARQRYESYVRLFTDPAE